MTRWCAPLAGAAAVGWNNPPVSWDEFERRLSWRARSAARPADETPPPADGPAAGHRQESTPAHQIPWAELHCHSAFSFLDGASQPAELVAEAAHRGVEALALTDHDGMYGAAQFARAAAGCEEETGVRVATIFRAEPGPRPTDGHAGRPRAPRPVAPPPAPP